MSFIYYFALALFMFVSVLLCAVILIQESRSMGLGASFGGEAGSSLFGTSTAAVVKKFTAWLAAIFLVGCILLSLWTAAMARSHAPSTTNLMTEQEVEN
jgi:preprotein translocase subunit SecG